MGKNNLHSVTFRVDSCRNAKSSSLQDAFNKSQPNVTLGNCPFLKQDDTCSFTGNLVEDMDSRPAWCPLNSTTFNFWGIDEEVATAKG